MNVQGEFYFVENNVPVGPFSLDELLTKNITKKTYIWTNGMENWQRIESLPEVLEKFNFGKVQPQTSDRSNNIESISNRKGINKSIFKYLLVGLLIISLAFLGVYFLSKKNDESISIFFKELKEMKVFKWMNSEFTNIKQAKNVVNPNGFREGRWVDFFDENNKILSDTSNGYSSYMLSEFKDGIIINEAKTYTISGVLLQVCIPFENMNKVEKTPLKTINFKMIKNFDLGGNLDVVRVYNDMNLCYEETYIHTDGGYIGRKISNEKISYNEWNLINQSEIIYYKYLDNISDSTVVKVVYADSSFLNFFNKFPEFKKIFDQSLDKELSSKYFLKSLIIDKQKIEDKPYRINYVTINSDTFFMGNIINIAKDEYKQKIARQESSNYGGNARCHYCGRIFNKSNGYVYNGFTSIPGIECTNYSDYSLQLLVQKAMGVSSVFAVYEKYNKYYCSERCCNYSGFNAN